MHRFNGKLVTVIISDRDKYLALKDVENSEELIGKPERMILYSDGFIPEYIEKEDIK